MLFINKVSVVFIFLYYISVESILKPVISLFRLNISTCLESISAKVGLAWLGAVRLCNATQHFYAIADWITCLLGILSSNGIVSCGQVIPFMLNITSYTETAA